MRVLVVGPDWEDGSEVGCQNGLRAMGHEATLFDPRKVHRRPASASALSACLCRGRVCPAWQPSASRFSRKAHCWKPPAGCASTWCWWSSFCGCCPKRLPSCVRGIVCAGWFPDAFTSFGRGTFLLAPWEWALFQDRFMVKRLRQSLSADYIHHLPSAWIACSTAQLT